ncbi:AAC-rich mRNA clone AAC11 protein-like isoform X2 [Daktulosphaira vitifoliae]|nr:AAC-rich mRNA clone AAC11 protein-like isoform X2 [Daktulosphaira vitifoliae]XP_050526727.1 AAC-rich mRNA clone AAC11 protein-like isoform X2 [Daktulosphaira vitifoliae]
MFSSTENVTDDNCVQEQFERIPINRLPKRRLQMACQCSSQDNPSNNVPTTSAWIWETNSKTNCTGSEESNCTQLRCMTFMKNCDINIPPPPEQILSKLACESSTLFREIEEKHRQCSKERRKRRCKKKCDDDKGCDDETGDDNTILYGTADVNEDDEYDEYENQEEDVDDTSNESPTSNSTLNNENNSETFQKHTDTNKNETNNQEQCDSTAIKNNQNLQRFQQSKINNKSTQYNNRLLYENIEIDMSDASRSNRQNKNSKRKKNSDTKSKKNAKRKRK